MRISKVWILYVVTGVKATFSSQFIKIAIKLILTVKAGKRMPTFENPASKQDATFFGGAILKKKYKIHWKEEKKNQKKYTFLSTHQADYKRII